MGLLDGNGRPPGPVMQVAQPLAADGLLALIAAALAAPALDLHPAKREYDEARTVEFYDARDRARRERNSAVIHEAVAAAMYLFEGAHVMVVTRAFERNLAGAVAQASADPRDSEAG